MKKFGLAALILFLVLSTAVIKNTTKQIEDELFTAKENNNNYTRPIIRIAILAIAISVAVMILSVFILSGFKDNISNKVIGFGSHIKITKFNKFQGESTFPKRRKRQR